MISIVSFATIIFIILIILVYDIRKDEKIFSLQEYHLHILHSFSFIGTNMAGCKLSL